MFSSTALCETCPSLNKDGIFAMTCNFSKTIVLKDTDCITLWWRGGGHALRNCCWEGPIGARGAGTPRKFRLAPIKLVPTHFIKGTELQ
jgi:hypothetical protein